MVSNHRYKVFFQIDLRLVKFQENVTSIKFNVLYGKTDPIVWSEM